MQSLLKYFGLLLLLWNARGLQTNLLEFQNFIDKKKPQIICVTETFLKPGTQFKMKGYVVYRSDRAQGRGGGLAIFIKNNLPSVENTVPHFPGGYMEALSVRCKLDKGWINIYNFYNPCQNVSTNEFDYYFEQASANSLYCGDFNGHHSMWSPDSRVLSNATGKHLYESLCGNVNFSLLTPKGLGTYTDNRGNDSTLDLCFGSGFLNNVDEVYKCPPLGGDHYPVLYGFTSHSSCTEKSALKWDFKDMNWFNWGKELIKHFKEGKAKLNNLLDFSNYVVNFTKGFAKLKNNSFNSRAHKAFWSEECSRAVALRRRARRIFKKHPSLENKIILNRATANSRRVLKMAKRKSWRDFCSTLDFSVSETFVWRIFKSLQGRSTLLNYPICSELGETLTKIEIAEKFADSFATYFQRRARIPNEDFFNSVVIANGNIIDNHPINEIFTMSELKNAIESVNTRSAIGHDSFHNKFLWNLPHQVQQELLNLINDSWVKGLYHTSFKLSILVPLPKPGRDHSHINSYRPISLLSCLGKLFEKLIYQRLYWYLENKNKIPMEQTGFRKNHSCIDTLLYLEKHIQIALRSQQILIIVFFDIEKAFDSVNHTAILYKLSNMGIKGRIFRWLQDFFLGRFFKSRGGVRILRNKENL